LYFSISFNFGYGQIISNITTDPSIINNGTSFTIIANVLNNSSNTIGFFSGSDSPLDIIFNKDIVNQKDHECEQQSVLLFLKPDENQSIIDPGCAEGFIFKANVSEIAKVPEIANAKITFTYSIMTTDERPDFIPNETKSIVINKPIVISNNRTFS